MRSRAFSFPVRITCACSFMVVLALGPIGCGAGSAPENTPRSDLPPEVKQANKSMEDFEKERIAGKK